MFLFTPLNRKELIINSPCNSAFGLLHDKANQNYLTLIDRMLGWLHCLPVSLTL